MVCPPLQPSIACSYDWDWIPFPGQSSNMEKHDKELRNVRMSPAVSFHEVCTEHVLRTALVHTSDSGLMEKIDLKGWFDLSLP